MANVEYLKRYVKPRDLAQRTLGEPLHRNWYKSPFRAEERTPSFEVSDLGFHDFGTGEHYDIIAFIQELHHCSFKEAVDTLCKMYGLTENEYENKRIQRYLEDQRLAKKAYTEKVEKWYLDFLGFVFEEVRLNEACIDALKDYPDTLKFLYDRQVFLGCLEEEVLNTSTFQQKEKLRNDIRRKGLPEWMSSQRRYFLT